MIMLARLSREGEDVQGAVQQVSESVGRAEEGWRRVQVGYVEWVNRVTRSSQGLATAAKEGGEQEWRGECFGAVEKVRVAHSHPSEQSTKSSNPFTPPKLPFTNR
jgi:hypothetical protein